MTYRIIHKARTHHNTRNPDGTQATRYSPYELGMIMGERREILAVIVDTAGFDGLGFDSGVGGSDDHWHAFNVFKNGHYVDTLAVGGALDNDHALEVGRSQMDHLGGNSCVMIVGNSVQFDSASHNSDTWSIDAFSKLMNNPSQDQDFLPLITAAELNEESMRVCFDSAIWGEGVDLKSHGAKVSRLHLDMVRADSRHQLTDPFNLAEELANLNATRLDESAFDALMDTESRLGLLKDRLFSAMSKASIDGLAVQNVTQTKPFKRQGVANIAFVFDLSDGQTVSIWFHNPDTTPSKLMPSDIMISWKWLLNKRDVTAALSPKQGDNVQLPTLARRIMLVASKNSKRFKATQARTAKAQQELIDTQADIDQKNATINQLDVDISELNSKISAALKTPNVNIVTDANGTTDDTIDEDEIKDTIDELDNQYSTGNEFWNRSINYVQSLSDEQFRDLEAALTNANYHNESTIFRARRVGNDDYINEANSILEAHQSNGSMTRELSAQRNALNKKIDAALRSKNTKATKVEFTDKGEITTEYGPSENGIPESVTMTFAGESGRINIPPKTAKSTTKGKTYLPVEHGEGGSYIAYMNTKKKDHWQAIPGSDGRFTVYAENAASSGRAIPKVFDNVADLVARYPAFTGIEALIAENDAKAAIDAKPATNAVPGNKLHLGTDANGEPITYKQASESTELLDEYGRDMQDMLDMREDDVITILLENMGWDKASELTHTANDNEYSKNGHILSVTTVKNDKPSGSNSQTNFYNDALVWELTTSDFNYKDLLEIDDNTMAQKINKAARGEVTKTDNANAEIFAQDFFMRNKRIKNVLGFTDNDVEMDSNGVYDVLAGSFKGKTLKFTDTVCKLVNACHLIGADIVISDFTSTAYQDSMFDNAIQPIFDGLNSQSKPTYGITAQISIDGNMIRASVDEKGDCQLLQGSSGETVISKIDFTPADNSTAYQAKLSQALMNKGNKMNEPTGKNEDPVTLNDESKPIPDQVNGTLADRIQVIQGIVDNAAFEPSDIDNDELIALVDETEGDPILSAQIDAILSTYQDKLVAISMKALSSLAGN